MTLTGRDWTEEQTLLLKNTKLFFQKLISERESSERKTSLSQERAEFTTKKRNLVIIWAKEPTQGEREIIWPVTMATPFTCTLQGGWQDSSSTRPAFNFSIRSSVACIVPSIVSRITPNQVITRRGSQRDFSSLGTNPDLSKSEWTTKLLTLAETKSVPPPKPSSRKWAIGMPWLLHDFCNVKTYGAEETRKEARRLYELWKFSELKISWNPVPKIPSKSEKFSVVWENFNVVITRLKVKFKQVIITIKTTA